MLGVYYQHLPQLYMGERFQGLKVSVAQQMDREARHEEWKEKEEAKKEAAKQQRVKDSEYLAKSKAVQLLAEAGGILSQVYPDVTLSVTSPDAATEERVAVDARLSWGIRNTGIHWGVGSDPAKIYDWVWNEVNLSLVRTDAGKIKGFRLNTEAERSGLQRNEVIVPNREDDLQTAVEIAVQRPLFRSDETWWDTSPIYSKGRVNIPLKSPES